MNWIRNAKVGTKLFLMTSIFLISLIIVGFAGYYYLGNSNEKINSVYKDKLLPIEYIGEAKNTYNSSNKDLFELMITTDNNRNKELVQSINTKKEAINKSLTDYSNTKLDQFEVDNIKLLSDNLATAEQLKASILDLALANKNTEAYEKYNKELNPINQKIEKSFSDLTDYNIKTAEQLNVQNGIDFTKARFIVIGIILISILLGTYISIFTIRLIVTPIKSFESYIEKVADGDLSEETLSKSRDTKTYNDEIGKLGHSIVSMRGKLRDLLSKVSDASEQILASSEELNANADQSSMATEENAKAVSIIAEGAEKQLNTVINTSNIIQQMSNEIQQSDTNIDEMTKVAEKTLEATDNGEKAINKTKEQMNNIEQTVVGLDGLVKKLGERSNEIGQIIETISGIAEQTNLLALNAAIEAARAGESGKGFAVVADEVRKLAEESKEATEKISKLIREIQNDTNNAVFAMKEGTDQVKIGMEIVNKAGMAFNDISELVDNITNRIEEVALSSENISTGSQQVVMSINEVDTISKDVSNQSQLIAASIEEQSAAMQEIAGASHGLSKIAENLTVELSNFKL